MRQDKDRGGKWLLAHHGDAVLRLAGLTGFTRWRAVPPETVAPRRLPDGLLGVEFPDRPGPTLVLVEIETYPDPDADRQVLDDVMLLAVDRRAVPEVVSLVLKPKGNLAVRGAAERASPSGRTRVGGAWPVVRLWELDAEPLLAADDPGLIPWVPLTRTTLGPEELLTRCRDRLERVPEPHDREGLKVVTQILAGLAFPGYQILNLFGGSKMFDIGSPLLEEIKDLIRAQALRDAIKANLMDRFGAVPEEQLVGLADVTDVARLNRLIRLAVTCPDLDTFLAALAAGT